MFERPIYSVPRNVETKWCSPENFTGEKGKAGMTRGGRKGSAKFPFGNGEERVLAFEKEGSGVVRRLWMTFSDFSKEVLRGVTIEFYWDQSDKPAVSVPIGDFFCHSIGRMATFKSSLFTSPEGRNFTCYIPMPFRKGFKVLIRNESGKNIQQVYYDLNYTMGDQFDDDTMYFHAWFNRESPTTLRKDYQILSKVEGRGRYLGTNIGVLCNQELYCKTWWGEGEVKIYIDGDQEYPSLCGTGSEDYLGSAWGQNYFYDLYSGCPVYDTEKMELDFFRFHVPDPVYFQENIRVEVQQIGAVDTFDLNFGRAELALLQQTKHYSYPSVNGDFETDFIHPEDDPEFGQQLPFLFEREDDWCSCAYFYLDKPVNGLPLLPLESRLIK